MTNVIEIHDITHEFSSKRVLDHINLSVKKGEIMGLLGPSGAGKTTLVKILVGQLKQTSGEAHLLGIDTLKLDSSIHRKMGIMMDNFGLYERLSVFDNMNLFAKIFEIPRTRIDSVLKDTGLYDFRKKPVSKLSKGMMGRLKLARAVMNDAELLFLDEPTSGLDPSTAKEIHRLLLAEKEKGTAIFLTTHNMAEAEALCDNIALLNQGEIVEYGNPQKICQRYNHLNKIQIQLKDNQTLELNHDNSAADQIKMLFEQDCISTIHSTEPNLETVFLELTGRRLIQE